MGESSAHTWRHKDRDVARFIRVGQGVGDCNLSEVFTHFNSLMDLVTLEVADNFKATHL